MLVLLGVASPFKTCKDMSFCRNEIDQKHSYSFSRPNLVDGRIEGTLNSFLNLEVYKLVNGGIRFRVKPISDEKYMRYDVSKNNLVVDNLDECETPNAFEQYEDHIRIGYPDVFIEITEKPFRMNIYKNNQIIASVNAEDLLIFNHHLNDPHNETFQGFVDQIPETTSVGIDISLPKDSLLTGLSERPCSLNIPDGTYRLFNTDGRGWEAYEGIHTYGNIPFLISHSKNAHTSLFWLNPSDTFVKLQTLDNSRSVRFLSEGGYIDLIIFCGSSHQSNSLSFINLTGKPIFAPLAMLGYQQCRWGYRTQESVNELMSNLESSHFPYDVIWLDLDHLNIHSPFQFNPVTFPDPQSIIDKLSNDHRYLVRLSDCHLPINGERHRQSKEAQEKQYFVKAPNGKKFVARCWPGPSIWVDYFNPDARNWWASQYHYEADIAGPSVFFWNDMNEPAILFTDELTFPKSAIHFGGYTNREVHNIYGLMNTVATYKGITERDIHKRPFILTRSHFAGSQKYCWTWTGDNTANWGHLAMSIQQVVTSGLCGMPFTGADVGGFIGNPTTELLIRWYQLAALGYPLFREHAIFNADPREPYIFVDWVTDELRKSVQFRYRMISFWYTISRETCETGLPIVKPIWYLFNELDDVEDEFILGQDVLICPVLEEGQKERKIRVPKGSQWFDLVTGEEVQNEIDVNISSMPAYLRAGRIIPWHEDVAMTVYETVRKNLTLIVGLDENGRAEGSVYLDDGETLDYEEKEEFIKQEFLFENGKIKSTKNYQKEFEGDWSNVFIEKVVVYQHGEKPIVHDELSLQVNGEWEVKIF